MARGPRGGRVPSPMRSNRGEARRALPAGEGRARAALLSACLFRSILREEQARSRAPSEASVASSSAFTGTAISAAPVGVGARMSAARSISVQSVSWPTAEITGISDAATARTTASSLKPHRSSRLPPPRATMIRSGRGIGPPSGSALNPLTAAVTSAAQVSPCTRTGHTTTCSGNRSLMRCTMSRMTVTMSRYSTSSE